MGKKNDHPWLGRELKKAKEDLEAIVAGNKEPSEDGIKAEPEKVEVVKPANQFRFTKDVIHGKGDKRFYFKKGDVPEGLDEFEIKTMLVNGMIEKI